MGNVMRQDILSRAGLTEQVAHEAIDNLLYMADISGTLGKTAATKPA